MASSNAACAVYVGASPVDGEQTNSSEYDESSLVMRRVRRMTEGLDVARIDYGPPPVTDETILAEAGFVRGNAGVTGGTVGSSSSSVGVGEAVTQAEASGTLSLARNLVGQVGRVLGQGSSGLQANSYVMSHQPVQPGACSGSLVLALGPNNLVGTAAASPVQPGTRLVASSVQPDTGMYSLNTVVKFQDNGGSVVLSRSDYIDLVRRKQQAEQLGQVVEKLELRCVQTEKELDSIQKENFVRNERIKLLNVECSARDDKIAQYQQQLVQLELSNRESVQSLEHRMAEREREFLFNSLNTRARSTRTS